MRTKKRNSAHAGGRLPAALGGLLAGYAALAVAELVSAAVRPQASPVLAVGSAAIDRAPAPVKDWAIREFGTNDKLALQLGIVAVLGVIAVALGLLALHSRTAGSTGMAVSGAVGVWAALSRPDATGFADALPSLVGACAGAALLYDLAGRLRARTTGDTASVQNTAPGSRPNKDSLPFTNGLPPADGTREPGWDRRGFVTAALAAAAASTGAGLAGRSLNGDRGSGADASRLGVVLPAAASSAPPLPGGAGMEVPGISPFITPNRDFYRVDTALVVPKVDATAWRLRIHGKGVARERTFTFEDLLGRELVERRITLTCVSNQVGGPYVGNARWIGVRLADLLAECGVRPPSHGGPADQLVARSVDGMTLGTPVEVVMDGRDALLALGMNGEPLPFAHGFPVRMVVPGLYGFVSGCKWIQDIELTTFDAYDTYWVRRGWARTAPVKTQSRIDTPRPFARPRAGGVVVAGVAWAQHRGIDKVEVRVDDGPWRAARLATEDTADTWRQWSLPWQAAPGTHTLTVRATDRTGVAQTPRRTRTIPDGADGWHSVVVTVV
ncbi:MULTISPECIES: molybdopterin-dependent oxidoreductase [unclassified Streptomyces]|uniref:molybdopterin-dependent oxidoreductase n=1 Tax=unclassified Streptomyces TaxID=2593676 RepID=UPI000689C70C|nr:MULTISPECIES: molybdopterin-dependent oxidoreductase [unclassified Streptomyces]MCH0561288.1 molybdopterin-dependent oxidoreductase [Streptomyces sp. MUM 16J]